MVIDSAEQVVDLSDPPWEAIDPTDHWVEVDLTDLVNGGSRRGIRTSGTVVAIANNSGIIERCPECRRVMRDGECAEHGPQRGEEDVRLRIDEFRLDLADERCKMSRFRSLFARPYRSLLQLRLG